MIQSYITHDNGDRPFKVIINPVQKTFTIHKYVGVNRAGFLLYDPKPLHKDKYQVLFVGQDPNYNYIGNSILFKIKPHQYIWIGYEVTSFTIKDEIVDFMSPVGNSDVPYPYAIGTQNTYLLIENTYIPNYLRTKQLDPYEQYYGLYTGGLSSKDSESATDEMWNHAHQLASLHRPIKQFFSNQFKFKPTVIIERR